MLRLVTYSYFADFGVPPFPFDAGVVLPDLLLDYDLLDLDGSSEPTFGTGEYTFFIRKLPASHEWFLEIEGVDYEDGFGSCLVPVGSGTAHFPLSYRSTLRAALPPTTLVLALGPFLPYAEAFASHTARLGLLLSRSVSRTFFRARTASASCLLLRALVSHSFRPGGPGALAAHARFHGRLSA